MKRLATVVLVTVVAGVALATWGGAASAREANEAQKLPALPSNIKERGRFNIGIKCDAPPFGYIDVRGRNVGFDVEIARWFSRFAFGKSNRITFTCLTTPAREPALTTDRVDMVIATFTYTADRDTRIDFSRAYYKATGTLLVPNSAPNTYLPTLAGKTIATTSGSIYDRWIKNCFKDTKLVVTDSFTNALLAFRDGRADALMWDDAVLVAIAAADRNLKLTSDRFLALPYGIGIKQGNTALRSWVNSRLEVMRKRDTFNTILKNNVPARVFAGFQKNILRPNNTFTYTQGDETTKCP
ncbi:MAG TPA: transporter substrate-binding domain-containing protein [Gaiellaceae bacterium]|jgi:polar amino acid transport system substrate-binding protein|nr:transporter substrate-binding domain-containing protein [Gaiellaceae bacterium]